MTTWKSISKRIAARVSVDGFQRWFSDVEVSGDDGVTLTLSVPNPIQKFFIESNYLALVQGAVSDAFEGSRTIRIVARQSDDMAEPQSPSVQVVEEPEPPRTTGRERVNGTAASSGMNPRNTFDSFVVGSNNQFAYAAALAVAQAPAKTYNPLFVYGGSGLGKTHLLQAIGHHILASRKGAKVFYVSSEQFTNEFIDAIQHGTLVKFRKKYRHADALMIDDIQFLAGKERSQEEFFHTFNTLHDGHKQIILSSDRPASEIEKLEQRLVSRFEWGMTAELQPPDMETRIAILQSKAAGLKLELEQWIIEFLADKIRNNVRRLEGALMRVASYRSLSGRQVTREDIEMLLRDIFQEQARKAVTIDQIQRKVAEMFDLRIADMTSKRRLASIAYPRQIAMYLSRQMTNSTLIEIGDSFGGKDHGTVIHACKLIKRRITEDERTRHMIRSIETQLQR
ncbi:MAG TPA: chromosomal replication initiator protein DnaA [Chthoniobacterales bacterium]|nr:chromosomal replication initiator protein DnaA [Chthoniobacterales bacterium]